ncbi:MAG: hypothetical protein C3F11_01775 [Methylocystaceae bacterium]|nr:MAG: hypothetical protein C3F11_01775 [Methylocystaceae bacterium]
MPLPDAIPLEAYYSYGYKGREMIAVRAPSAMTAEASEIIGRPVRIGARRYMALGIGRQVVGPIQAGEPIGLEVRELRDEEAESGEAATSLRG